MRHEKQICKSSDNGDNGEGQPNTSQCVCSGVGDMSDIHAINNAVQNVDKLGKSHRDSQAQDIA